jgi:hypothetical protein
MKQFCFLVLALLLVSAFPFTSVRAAEGARLSPPLGRHIIILIDDSADMRKFDKEDNKQEGSRIQRELIRLLEEGVDSFRSYDPKIDRIDLGFYGLAVRNDSGHCFSVIRQLSRDTLFDWVSLPASTGLEQIGRALDANLIRECRFKVSAAPIATAPALALPAITARMAGKGIREDRYFERIQIINVTNDFFNVLPSKELTSLARRFNVSGTEDGAELADRVQSAFTVRAPLSQLYSFDAVGNRFVGQTPTDRANLGRDPDQQIRQIRFQIVDVQPTGNNLTGLFEPAPRYELDRVAVASDKVLLQDPATGRPLTSPLRATLTVKPLVLKSMRGKASEIRSGQGPVEVSTLSLAEICSDGCSLRLQSLAGLPDLMALADPVPAGETLSLEVSFAYSAPGIYDRILLTSPVRKVEVAVRPALTLPAGASLPIGPLNEWLQPALTLTNALLAKTWSHGDQTLDQRTALARLQGWRDSQSLSIYAALTGLLIMATYLLYLRTPGRPFRPELSLSGFDPIVIDLNGTSDHPILTGRLIVRNLGQPGLLARLLRKTQQPAVDCQVQLQSDSLRSLAFEPKSPGDLGLGFLAGDTGPLRLNYTGTLHDGSDIPVFFAIHRIADFLSPTPAGGDVSRQMQALFTLVLPQGESVQATCVITLTVQPERTRLPLVELLPHPDRAEFSNDPSRKRGPLVAMARVVIRSQARHQFAIPFQPELTVSAYRGTVPVSGTSFRLEGLQDPLGPMEERELLLQVNCDGHAVPNPEALKDVYHLRLSGPVDPASETGPLDVPLFRDSTRPDIGLVLEQDNSRHYMLCWSAAGKPHRVDQFTGEVRPANAAGVIEIDPAGDIVFEAGVAATHRLFLLRLSNTARNGKGRVTVTLSPRLEIGDEAALSLELVSGTPDSLPVIFDDQTNRPDPAPIVIEEGDADAVRLVAINTRPIRDLLTGRIESDNLCLVLTVSVLVQSPGEADRSQSLTVRQRFALELQPPANILCIDYGTSAIAVSIGNSSSPPAPIDLQRVVQYQQGQTAVSFATHDPGNSEEGSCLLPSTVLIDAERRRTAVPGKPQPKPGFPGYAPAELTPGDPSFVCLPAARDNLRKEPDRVIFALKSWLSRSSSIVVLNTPTRIEDENGQQQDTVELPLDGVLVSTLAALYEAYIRPAAGQQAGHLVLTYPNTYSPIQKQTFLELAERALKPRMGLRLPRQIQGVSESDAVAYHYVDQRRRLTGYVPGREEWMLVYDLGAGTLDLSVIRILWTADGARYPQEWDVRYRLGVPVAGNHLDGILARLVHLCLSCGLTGPDQAFEYIYPIVTKDGSLPAGIDVEACRMAIFALWSSIRNAKQGDAETPAWSGQSPLRIRLGEYSGDEKTIVKPVIGKEVELAPPDQLWLGTAVYDKVRMIELSIPAADVHSFAPLKSFVSFVTGDVIDAALAGAGVPADKINTVIVSGRGALWPGLRETVWRRFPAAREHPDLIKGSLGNVMKSAVSSGAIAWQQLNGLVKIVEPPPLPMALLFEPGHEFVRESDWPKARINFGVNDHLRLVQVAHPNPEPARDIKTLRRYFYLDVDGRKYLRRQFMPGGATVDKDVVRAERKTEANGNVFVDLSNAKARVARVDGHVDSTHPHVVRPPWPVGSVTLPEEIL